MSGPDVTFHSETNFHSATPILRVSDLSASLRYYTEVLGFTLDWEAEGMLSVSRGDCSLMLSHGDQGQPGTWVWVGVGDAESLHREYSAKGATIRLPPTNYPWALEFHIEDPDRHILRFGSDSLADRPIAEWVEWQETTSNVG